MANTIIQESQRMKTRLMSAPTDVNTVPLKRKVGYVEDVELAEARWKFQTMHIDNECS